MDCVQDTNDPRRCSQDLHAESSHEEDRVLRSSQSTHVKAAQDVQTYKNCILYAKADCLQFTRMMHEKLPVKLRNMVYQSICIEEQHIPVGPYFHFRLYNQSESSDHYTQEINKTYPQSDLAETTDTNTEAEEDGVYAQKGIIVLPDGRVKEDHSSRPASDILMPHSHIFNPRYVGSKLACETQEIYYTQNTFSICNVDNGVLKFLESDTSRIFNRSKQSTQFPGESAGIRPVDCVQRLQVRLKCEHFIDEMTSATDVEDLQNREQRFLNDLQASIGQLPVLLRHSRERDLSIEFVFMTNLVHSPYDGAGPHPDNYGMHFLVNLLQAVRNTVFQLMYERGKTVVTVIHHDEKLGPFPRNITGLYSLTREQWAYEKERNAGKGDWTRDFYILPAAVVRDELTIGFSNLEFDALIQERWGMLSALNTRSQQPVKEGRYWPMVRKD